MGPRIREIGIRTAQFLVDLSKYPFKAPSLNEGLAYERNGEMCRVSMGTVMCGEEGHQIPLIKAAEPGVVQPGEELTWVLVVASTVCWEAVITKAEITDVVCFIPEGKARTRMGRLEPRNYKVADIS